MPQHRSRPVVHEARINDSWLTPSAPSRGLAAFVMRPRPLRGAPEGAG